MAAPALAVNELLAEVEHAFRGIGRLDQATLRGLLHRLRRAQNDGPAEALASVFSAIAAVWMHLGDPKEALSATLNAYHHDRANPLRLVDVARAHGALGHFAEARSWALRAKTNSPASSQAAFLAFLALAKANGELRQVPEARAALSEASRLVHFAQPRDLMMLAHTCIDLKADDDAVEFVARAHAKSAGDDLGEMSATDYLRIRLDDLTVLLGEEELISVVREAIARDEASPQDVIGWSPSRLTAQEIDRMRAVLRNPPSATDGLTRLLDGRG